MLPYKEHLIRITFLLNFDTLVLKVKKYSASLKRKKTTSIMVFRATIQSQITLFLLQSSNVLKKKTHKGFLLKGLLFLRKRIDKLTKQWSPPLGICRQKTHIISCWLYLRQPSRLKTPSLSVECGIVKCL